MENKYRFGVILSFALTYFIIINGINAENTIEQFIAALCGGFGTYLSLTLWANGFDDGDDEY